MGNTERVVAQVMMGGRLDHNHHWIGFVVLFILGRFLWTVYYKFGLGAGSLKASFMVDEKWTKSYVCEGEIMREKEATI